MILPGKETAAADALSRSNHLRDPTKEEVQEVEQYIRYIHIHNIEEELEDMQLNIQNILQAQLNDPTLQEVTRWVTKGYVPKRAQLKGMSQETQAYLQYFAVLKQEEDGLLIMKSQGNRRIIIPEHNKLKEEAFKWSHQNITAGHFGQQGTITCAKTYFFWPGMDSYLKAQTRKCNVCLAKINKAKKTHEATHQPHRHGYPGQTLYVDLVGPLPLSPNKNKYVLTTMDGFSKYTTATPIPSKEATVVANALMNTWICQFGCPSNIHSDRGKEFENRLWSQLCDRLQISKSVTPSYNPQSNLVERFHRTLNQILRVYLTH